MCIIIDKFIIIIYNYYIYNNYEANNNIQLFTIIYLFMLLHKSKISIKTNFETQKI